MQKNHVNYHQCQACVFFFCSAETREYKGAYRCIESVSIGINIEVLLGLRFLHKQAAALARFPSLEM